METLNSIMFEKFMDDEISASTFCNLMTALESANSDAREQFSAMRPQAKGMIKQIRADIRHKRYKDAGKKIAEVNDFLDKCTAKLKEIKNNADDPVAEAVFGVIRNYVADLCVAIIALFAGGLIGASIAGIYKIINQIKDILDAVNDYKRGENINPYIDRLIRNIAKLKVCVKRLSQEIGDFNPANVVDDEVKESVNEDGLDLITTMYAEGTIDDETFMNLMTESDDEDDGCECYDKAIEILTKLKEKPGDEKLTKKLKECIEDCCECDGKGEHKEDDDDDEEAEEPEEVAEESTIVIESEDPVVAEIMESVEEMVSNLNYVSEMMNSDIMMTESADVLKTVMSDVKARLASVGNVLKDMKGKLVDVKDNAARSKIAKILNDLAKRFTALAAAAKEKITSVADRSASEKKKAEKDPKSEAWAV